ncbi:hypothetical protein ACV1MK_00565 [Klebsiella michiganensis]
MNDFMFFELTYKLSEILKIASSKTQGNTAMTAIYASLLGVGIGFSLTLIKDWLSGRAKKKKYLNCIKWEANYLKDAAVESFKCAHEMLNSMYHNENIAIQISSGYSTVCFEKYFHEVLLELDDKQKNHLCKAYATVKGIFEVNEWLTSESKGSTQDMMFIKLKLLLNRSWRIITNVDVFLGNEDSIDSNIVITAKKLGISSRFLTHFEEELRKESQQPAQ